MDSEGFEQVLLEQKDRVFSYAAMVLRDPGEAQDVVQEAMVRLWKHQAAVDVAGAPMWLKKTTHNLCIDRIRRRKSRPEVGVEELDATGRDRAPGPQQLAESSELGQEIHKALEKLSATDRAVVVMREIQNLPYGEIADVLGMPLGTLKARLHRAREQLRNKLLRAGVTP